MTELEVVVDPGRKCSMTSCARIRCSPARSSARARTACAWLGRAAAVGEGPVGRRTLASSPRRASRLTRNRLGPCASGSTSPTTARTSAAGRASPDCARCRARSKMRSRRVLGGDPRSSSPGEPMPASTRPVRSRTSISTTRQAHGLLAPRPGRRRPGIRHRPDHAVRVPARADCAASSGVLGRRRRRGHLSVAPAGFDARSRRCGGDTRTVSLAEAAKRLRPAERHRTTTVRGDARRGRDGCRGPLADRAPRLRRLLQAA